MKKVLNSLLKSRILIIDGAMGSYIKQKHSSLLTEDFYRGSEFSYSHLSKKYTLKGNNDVLCITQPHIIKDIHNEYLDAGADFVTTCTFSSTKIEQEKYGLEDYVYQMNYEAAKIAKECCGKYKEKDKYVLGSIGPLSTTLSISTDVNDPSKREHGFMELVESYDEQVRGLIDGGADVLLIETIFDVLNAKAAIYAIIEYLEREKRDDIPVFVSLTVEKSGRCLSGQTVEAFFTSVEHSGLFSVGLNCGIGADFMFEYVKSLSTIAKTVNIHCYPNAGMPNEFGNYDETPQVTGKFLERMLKEGYVNMIGGCCGTKPKHIKVISEIAKKYSPRVLKEEDNTFRLCGLDHLVYVDNFLHIGERCNVAGSRAFKKLIVEENYTKALNVARKQVDDGAEILDICVDEPLVDGKKVIKKFLNLIVSEPEISKVPIMIDSSKFDIIISGLGCLQGKVIVNSISLKNGEEKFIKEAKEILKFGAAVVVMAFDEKGQAVTSDRKVEICKRAYTILTKQVGYKASDIIFDPNILTVGTGIPDHNNYAVEFIKACKEIKKSCPHAKLSGGVSNLSFSFRGMNKIREAMHSVFLYHAREAGLDMAIVNMGNLPIYSDIEEDLLKLIEDLVLNRSDNATDALLQYAETHKKDVKSAKKKVVEKEWRSWTVEERIQRSLMRGITTFLKSDIDELLSRKMDPVEIIQGPLMDSMNVIGELFGCGKMFLPQVIKSARVMKEAIDILSPIMAKLSKGVIKEKKKFLLATVKDDVHDIGKNIVGCILECNNYKVYDLGTMVDCKTIIKKAKEYNVDAIGLSGLITPSLDEMVFNVKEFKKNGMNIPVFVGGASTSEVHTAVKISPFYFPVIHIEDASQIVKVLNTVVNEEKKNNYYYLLKKKYEQIREDYYKGLKSKDLISIQDARKGKLSIDWSIEPPVQVPQHLGIKKLEIPVKNLIEKINWMYFFYTWGFRPKFPNNQVPEILNDKEIGAEVRKLYKDAKDMLKVIQDKLVGKAVVGLFRANSIGDDIEIYSNSSRGKKMATFYGLRQQLKKENENEPYYCLSDFIAPLSENITDHIGCCVGGIFGRKNIKESDKYKQIIIDVLCDNLAEALAEYLHELGRKELWGYSKDEKFTPKELFQCKYQGIRPALGYPSQPDHLEKRTLFELLNVENNIGVKLTDSTMMIPKSSTCSIWFSHPKSKYFAVQPLSNDQIEDYAIRKNCHFDEIQKIISPTSFVSKKILH